MKFNWVDLLSLGVVSTVGGIQLLRGFKDFSQILYETLLLIGALVGASLLYDVVHEMIQVPRVVVYVTMFVLLGALAIFLAALLNKLISFSTGVFDRIFSLITGIACGWVFGHVTLRLLVATRSEAVLHAIRKSWVASQVLHFGAFWEFLAMLRLARWHRL